MLQNQGCPVVSSSLSNIFILLQNHCFVIFLLAFLDIQWPLVVPKYFLILLRNYCFICKFNEMILSFVLLL